VSQKSVHFSRLIDLSKDDNPGLFLLAGAFYAVSFLSITLPLNLVRASQNWPSVYAARNVQLLVSN
jgi:hypothetical protein